MRTTVPVARISEIALHHVHDAVCPAAERRLVVLDQRVRFRPIAFAQMTNSGSQCHVTLLHIARYPPSTGRTTPVTNRAAGELRNTTAPATSAGSAQRPCGVRAKIAALRSVSSCSVWVNAVRTHPGASALTRMPSAAYAIASDFVSCATPPLLAL